jgi:aminopeptidase
LSSAFASFDDPAGEVSMQDLRLKKLAQVLVGYSTQVQKDDLVEIRGVTIAEPLIIELYTAVLEAGGHPIVTLRPDSLQEIFLRTASEKQLRYISPIARETVERIDVSIGIWADENTKALTGADPKRQAIASAARKELLNRFLERSAKKDLRCAGTQFPCHASAQDAEMSLREYEDFVFAAGYLYKDDPTEEWRKISERQQRVVDFLNGKKEIRLRAANGTDLRAGIEGRTWINCDGHENFPDGEVFTGPLEDTTRGTVCFSFPAVYRGREVNGVVLRFENGQVVDASAEKGEEFLIEMLDQDEGARVIGEIALGCNYAVTRYTKNGLFDEKIGGTFHAALGAAYPETGAKNQSGLHWDMVCDLRQGGTVTVDGKVISENGRFVRADWPQPLENR